MDKKHKYVKSDDNNALVSNCLDMMWDDSITDVQLDTLLKEVKSSKMTQKLSKYQYNQDVMRLQAVAPYVDVVRPVQEKIFDINNSRKLKEQKKFAEYQKLVADRSFFWPFSLPALALCSVFFIMLSISNNSYKINDIVNNDSEQYVFIRQESTLKNTNYIRVSALDDIAINFDSARLYSVQPNHEIE